MIHRIPDCVEMLQCHVPLLFVLVHSDFFFLTSETRVVVPTCNKDGFQIWLKYILFFQANYKVSIPIK